MTDPTFATELERELYDALLFASAALEALNENGALEARSIRFTGDDEELGTVTIGQVLNNADAALSKASTGATDNA